MPLTLLAVLAALLFLPGVASATSPTPEQCAADASLDGCPQASDNAGGAGTVGSAEVVKPPVTTPADGTTTGGTTTGGTPAGGNRVQGALVAPDVTTPTVPNCDALPGIGFPPCAPPACTPAGTDALPVDLPPPPCLPAPPPSCVPVPGLGGLCQFPDSDCPPPTTVPTAAAVTDGTCTPPITCDQFAQLFGFGDSCSDIPMCIPQDRVPPGFPIPIPSPPLCGPGAGGTPPPQTPTPPGKGTYMPPPAAQQPQQPYYANCDDARAHGATNIAQGTPGYRPELDSDSDGIACEDTTQVAAVTTTPQPTGTLAYTGVDLQGQLTLAWTLLMVGSALAIVTRRRA